MKLALKYIHLVISIIVVSYLGTWLAMSIAGNTISNMNDIIRYIIPGIFIGGLVFVIRRPQISMQKWIIVAGSIATILIAHALYTDTDRFYGGDFTKIYSALTLFFALFGIFAGKEIVKKGHYSKKAEIIEV